MRIVSPSMFEQDEPNVTGRHDQNHEVLTLLARGNGEVTTIGALLTKA
jgi:hypothetical protein